MSEESTSTCCRAVYCVCIFDTPFHIPSHIDFSSVLLFSECCGRFSQLNDDLLDYPDSSTVYLIIPYIGHGTNIIFPPDPSLNDGYLVKVCPCMTILHPYL